MQARVGEGSSNLQLPTLGLESDCYLCLPSFFLHQVPQVASVCGRVFRQGIQHEEQSLHLVLWLPGFAPGENCLVKFCFMVCHVHTWG